MHIYTTVLCYDLSQLEALVSRKRAYTEALLDPPDLVVSRKRLAHAT